MCLWDPDTFKTELFMTLVNGLLESCTHIDILNSQFEVVCSYLLANCTQL